MAVGVFGENIFYEKDTRVFASQSIGRPINITAVASNIATAVSHALNTGDRVAFATAPLTGVSVSTIYYIRRITADTFTLHSSLSNARNNSAILSISGTARMLAVDSFVPVTEVSVIDTETFKFTSEGHALQAGDLINITGLSDDGYLYLEGTYYIDSVSSNKFNVISTNAINDTIELPENIRVSLVSVWEIPSVDFSLSNGEKSEVVSLLEMTSTSGVSRRGSRKIKTAKNPVAWSLVTLPSETSLWANAIANNKYIGGSWCLGVSGDTSISFANSDVAELGSIDLYFVLYANKTSPPYSTNSYMDDDVVIIKVCNASVSHVNIPLNPREITYTEWSGEASEIVKAGNLVSSYSTNDKFIVTNKTVLELVQGATTFDITVVSAKIEIDNGIKYHTPEIISRVNKPVAHTTGPRRISGEMTIYLDEESNSSMDLVSALMAASVRNSFSMVWHIGGVGASPGLKITTSNVFLEMPQIVADDIITIAVKFHCLSDTMDTSEITELVYS